MSLPANPIGSLEIKSIISKVSQEDQVVDVPQIDFIFRDQQWKLNDCTQIWQILQLQSLMQKVPVRAKYKHMRKRCFWPTFRWQNRLRQTYMPCHADQKKRRTFVRLIFDPGGHFLNLWLDFLPCYQAVKLLKLSFSKGGRVDVVRSKKKRARWWAPLGKSFVILLTLVRSLI